MFLGEVVTGIASPVNVAMSATSDQPAWLTSLLNIGQGYLTLKQMNDMQKINARRLSAGLAPISAEDMAIGAKVAMDKGQLNKILLVSAGGIGLVALIVLLKNR